MSNEENLKAAQTVYETMCRMLDAKGLRYEKRPEKLSVHFIMGTHDIPLDIIAAIDPDRQLVRMMSFLPFSFSEENRVLGALATCHANYKLTDGSFDFNFRDGTVFFRLTSSFRDSILSSDALEYMLIITCIAVDEYNDKFLMLDKGILSLEDFCKKY